MKYLAYRNLYTALSMKRYSAFLFIPLLISACGTRPSAAQNETKTPPERKIRAAEWLIGSWLNPGKDGVAVEEWKAKDDSTFEGTSYVITPADTLILETIRIEERNGNLFYVPTVAGQNDGKPVTFTLTSGGEGKLVFENPQHDFPQKITYTAVGKDSLVAEVSGMADGQLQSFPIPMKRAK